MNKIYRLLRYDWPLHFLLLLTNWLPDNVPLMLFRGALARPFLNACGPGLSLGRDITFYNPSKISIGRNVYIAKGSWFLGIEAISIGDEVIFGPYSIVVTANHSLLNGSYRAGPHVNVEPIVIGRGSWISAHCTLLPGSTLGEASLIAANSVFSGISTPGSVYGGVPAKKIKEINIH